MIAKKLTRREAEIAAGVLAGLSNKAIADRLSISENTVKVHMQSMFRVTGATGRVQLARIFSGQDVAEPAPKSSPREREVLKLIALGKTSKEIAQQLNLSTKTIEAHRYNMMRRLGLHDRADVASYAARQGIVEIAVEGGGQ